MSNFGDRLRELRIEKGLTQEELATMFGMHKTRISQYELNKRQADDDTKKVFSKFFNVSLDYLMGVSDIREPADKILEKSQDTIALHRNDGYEDDLPEEARKEIEDFKEYVRHKYGKKKD